ncbi:hypothetical protein [Desertivirga xinjiangensis]|uniref:hypothetical protein n=1 Tax=Desertivirga xinjiangensis TaxID=539206 RepID=UPI00210B21CE|nr:hypothetical protein [Pedobacter xinjiangensis]
MSSLLAGCSAWKNRTVNKADSVVLKQEQTVTEVTIKNEQKEVLHSAHSDSLKEGYWIRIIPEGEFTYSPQKGFSGRASSLQIEGNRENWYADWILAERSAARQFDSLSDRSFQSKESVETKTTEKAPGRTMSWGIGLGVVLALTLFFILSKFVFSVFNNIHR